VDIDDFQDCFDKIVRAAYRFSPFGRQGKEIWCNLTGGTNAIGFGLLTMARLTGMSTKHYLISQRREYQREIRVPASVRIRPGKDEYFNIVPFLKTYVDTVGFYDILLEMESVGQAVKTGDLFDRLRSKGQFLEPAFDEFKRHYMLKLYSLGYTSYDKDTKLTEISESGRSFISELKDMEAVLEIEDIVRGKRDMIAESEKWPWFTVERV